MSEQTAAPDLTLCRCRIVGWSSDPYEPHIPAQAEWEQADDCPVHPLGSAPEPADQARADVVLSEAEREKLADAVEDVTKCTPGEDRMEEFMLPVVGRILAARAAEHAAEVERRDAGHARAVEIIARSRDNHMARAEAAEATVARAREALSRIESLAQVQAISCQAAHRADHARGWLDVLALIERAALDGER